MIIHRTQIAVAVSALLLAACVGAPSDSVPVKGAEDNVVHAPVDGRAAAAAGVSASTQEQSMPPAPETSASIRQDASPAASVSPARNPVPGQAASKGRDLAASLAVPQRRDRAGLADADSLVAPASRLAAQAHKEAGRMVMPMPSPVIAPTPADRERYMSFAENPVHLVAGEPVSTFSIDVDTGSYANVRRFIAGGRLPPVDAVRVEELINYFPYDDAQPDGEVPFAVHTELARAPWNADRLLLRIGIKGKDIAAQTLPPANLVFLVDVSGSMNSAAKLPLLKSALKLLVSRLRAQDRISIVTYAGATQVVLDAQPGDRKAVIIDAIDALRAGGGTAGASGIELAYRTARRAFLAQGINRILLATDGDFNVGVTDFGQLKAMVETQRASGVSLSTLGFGTGNYNEHLMEQLADAGDGAYSYVDNLMEAQKVLVTEMSSTLATIAQDVKIQVEFNPATVTEYRLIGYENRLLAREDFNNDRVDAGDIGAGHTVTALYELTPVGARPGIDPLRYGGVSAAQSDGGEGVAAHGAERRSAYGQESADELAFIKLRYKRPGNPVSELISRPVLRADAAALEQRSADFRFGSAIAAFGQILRGGRYTGSWQIADARALAATAIGNDRFGYRSEALRLMDLAQALKSGQGPLAVQDPAPRAPATRRP
ncbi:MAG: VWA domain-containing protein [Burkholderiaceae bacterium]